MTSHDELCFAVVPPGLEVLAAEELVGLGATVLRRECGGVTLRADRATLYRLHLHARLAVRIRIRVGSFRAKRLDGLAQGIRKLDLSPYATARQPFAVRVSSSGSALQARSATVRKAENAIRDAMRGAGGKAATRGHPSLRDPVEFLIRIEGDEATVSVDASGERLHRRGWRKHTTEAPLRENLAAAVLHLAGWHPDEALVDPMCGSGTFPIEAATIAAAIPPGSGRRFAFERWPSHDQALWRAVRAEGGGAGAGEARIFGYDIDGSAVRAARANAARAKVDRRVSIARAPVSALSLSGPPGLVVCNPPYGARIKGAPAAWRDLGVALRERGAGWRLAVLAPDGPGAALVRRTGLALQPIAHVDNGGITVVLYVGSVDARASRSGDRGALQRQRDPSGRPPERID